MTVYLADTSAWHHARSDAVATEWARRLAEDSVGTCAQVKLEVLYSARGAADYDRLAEELEALHQLPCGVEHYARALDVQRALAHQAGLHHRSVKIADLIIAASAEAADATLWHYDEDFERIAVVTGQSIEWVAPRGSL